MESKDKITNATTSIENRFGRIGVLMGGHSSEREISLKSGKAVYASLKQEGFSVIPIEINTEDKSENIRLLKAKKIDCAFIALHGRFGEDGQIQQILDSINIPYTGSDASASKLAMDKIAARNILASGGICVPRCRILEKSSGNFPPQFSNQLNLPWVVKPATHGSSIGISVIDRKEDLAAALEVGFGFDQRLLVEEYIRGRELTVGILDDRPLPVIEIIPKKRFFDYQAKYQLGLTDYIVPADLSEKIAKLIQSQALTVHKLLGCSGCSRVDLILNPDNTPFILELNSIPGFTPTSLLPKAAGVAGIEFGQLCIKLISLAYEKGKDKFRA